MLLFIQLYAILFYLAIGNASLMLLINLLTNYKQAIIPKRYYSQVIWIDKFFNIY